MQSSQDRNGDNGARSFDATAHLSVMPSACLSVIRRIGGKNSPQVRLAEDQNLVQALATQCANQTFRNAICHGDPGEIGRSRIPMVLTQDVKPDFPFLKDEVLKGIGFPGPHITPAAGASSLA
jgi:hypothetical protein